MLANKKKSLVSIFLCIIICCVFIFGSVISASAATYAAWSSSSVYVGGNMVSYDGNDYKAKWWTQGEVPGVAAVWELTTTTPPPSGTYPAWSSSSVYVGGNMVSYSGNNYKAKWWTQGEVPGVAAVWELVSGDGGGGTPPTFPQAPALTDNGLNNFMSHVKYYSGSTVSDIDSVYLPVFREYLQVSGEDAFVNNLIGIKPNLKVCIVDNNNVPTGIGEIKAEWVNGFYAYAIGDYVVFGKTNWENNPDRRVPTLMHETMHHIDNGIVSATSTVINLYNSMISNTSAQWDEYAKTNPAEYLACGAEWVLKNDVYKPTETKRERLKRMDPNFYNWLVNDFIPNNLFN